MSQSGNVVCNLLHYGNYSEARRTIQPVLDHIAFNSLSVFTNHTSFWSWAQNNYQAMEGHVYMVSRFVNADELLGPNIIKLLTEDLLESIVSFKACTIVHTGGKFFYVILLSSV